MSYSFNGVTYPYSNTETVVNLISGTYTLTGHDSQGDDWDSKLIITDELSGTTTDLTVIGSSTAVDIKVTGTCSACTAGQYQNENALVLAPCKACPDGTYQLDTPDTCQFCPVGFASIAPDIACTACAAGQYQTQNNAPAAACSTCSAGKFSPNAQTECDDCETGKYQLAAAPEYQCKFCAAGYAFTSESTACTACTAGQYQNQNDAPTATCSTCSAGKFSLNAQTACVACDEGKYQLTVATEYQCKFCAAGSAFTSESTACTACAAGQYQDENALGSATCKFCAAGKTSDGTACTNCDGYNLDPREDCKPMSELPVDYQNHQCCQNCASGTEADCAFTDGSVHDKCGCMAYQA